MEQGSRCNRAVDFDGFLQEVCPPLDLQWRAYRRRAARHRVLERAAELGLAGLEDYLAHLRRHPGEAAALPDAMRVTVSRFFRERECWRTLAERHLPVLVRPLPEGRALRAWSAGCCGGEEPYTLALLWREWVESRFPGRTLEVTATDIDAASLERADAATYAASSLREVPPEVRARWFRPCGPGWRLEPEAREPVRFLRHNLAAEEPPGLFDLVLCRYLVFTYYRGERRLQAARRLASALLPGGLLFIGRKEGLGPREREHFEPLAANCGIYRVTRAAPQPVPA